MDSNKPFPLLELPTELIKDIIGQETATLRIVCRLLCTLAATHFFCFNLELPSDREFSAKKRVHIESESNSEYSDDCDDKVAERAWSKLYSRALASMPDADMRKGGRKRKRG